MKSTMKNIWNTLKRLLLCCIEGPELVPPEPVTEPIERSSGGLASDFLSAATDLRIMQEGRLASGETKFKIALTMLKDAHKKDYKALVEDSIQLAANCMQDDDLQYKPHQTGPRNKK